MEDRSLKRKVKPEISTTENSSISGGSNISLYLGAGAFLISIATAILLYREISKIKNSMTDVKHVKNQMMNMDSRFEEMDERLQQVLKSVTTTPKTNNVSFNPVATVVKDTPQEDIEGVEEESDEEESSDDEISYEEESSDEE